MSPLLDVEIALLLPIALGVGWLAGRLLDIRQTWGRIFLTGLIGWLLGVALANWSVVSQNHHESTLELRVAAFSVLATMATSVGVDFVARPGSRDRWRRAGRLPSAPHPVRRAKMLMAPPRRFREVVEVARRQGLLHRRFASATGISDPDFGPCLRATLEECGGMFVKFGQVASTRRDLLPEPLIDALSRLQSSVAPESPEAMHALLEEEIGGPTERIFASFDWDPLAAASIAQVHRATLYSGERVVVKVQRPNVADVVERDSNAMLSLARFVQRRTALGLRIDLMEIMREFTDAVKDELDFSREARSTERVRRNRLGDRGVRIPKVFTELCTSRMLVLEEVPGRQISDAEALNASPVPRETLADRLLTDYLAQILHDGVFHADPHPGNILLDATGTLYLLDFGSTGILDAATLDGLGKVILSLGLNDSQLFEQAVLALAPPPPGIDMNRLTPELARFMAVYVEQDMGFSIEMLRDLIGLLQRHRFDLPISLTLLGRCLLTLDGTLHVLAPEYPLTDRVAELARPMIAGTQPAQVAESLQRELLKMLPALQTLPGHAQVIAGQLRSGELTVKTRPFGDRADAAFFRDLVNRAVMAAIGLTGILASAVILFASTQARPDGDRVLLEGIGYAGLFLGSMITMRVMALIVRDRSA